MFEHRALCAPRFLDVHPRVFVLHFSPLSSKAPGRPFLLETLLEGIVNGRRRIGLDDQLEFVLLDHPDDEAIKEEMKTFGGNISSWLRHPITWKRVSRT